VSENEDSCPRTVSESRFLISICAMAVFEQFLFYSTVASSQHLHFFTVRSHAALAVKLTSGFGPWVRCVGQVHVARRPGRCDASTRYTWRVDQVGATRRPGRAVPRSYNVMDGAGPGRGSRDTLLPQDVRYSTGRSGKWVPLLSFLKSH
jgi:hypothetical protein